MIPQMLQYWWLQRPDILEQHQTLKHAVSELIDGDSGNNIVRIIFKTGWIDTEKTPKIHGILKIHHSTKILGRFEEYREHVKSKAAQNSGIRRRDERCIADSNKLLRFHCSTFLCNLGQNGNSGFCNHQYCSICGIIRSGFSQKLDLARRFLTATEMLINPVFNPLFLFLLGSFYHNKAESCLLEFITVKYGSSIYDHNTLKLIPYLLP